MKEIFAKPTADDQESTGEDTLWGYAATRILDTPFWGLYNMLPFILYKDLGASPFQIAALVSLRPILSIFSMYWSRYLNAHPGRLISNILWSRLLGILPFLFFPFVSTPWFYILAYGGYMMIAMGTMPAWMEILKVNLPKNTREKVFAYTQAFGYMGGGLFPFFIGYVLDGYFQAWRWLFPAAALLTLLAAFFQKKIDIPSQAILKTPSVPIFEKMKTPWKEALNLLKARSDFTQFQIGFMLVGCGLMVIQPALPMYFTDTLNLSYIEMALAITLCKGIGFAAASPYWARFINKYDIFPFSGTMALLASLFPLFLLMAKMNLLWLFGGYILYGIAQAGNDLTWSMSGPIFSKEENSSLYSSVNVVAVGLRGIFVPLFGSLLISSFSLSYTLFLGAASCLLGARCLFYFGKKRFSY